MTNRMIGIGALALLCCLLSLTVSSGEFASPEDPLRGVRSIRYENVYTKVPSPGKLVAIKITDDGKTYYVCQEKTGYVIYHLDVRPVEALKEKMEGELNELSRKWDATSPNELLFTRKRFEAELKKRIYRYSDAVWVRNEIIVGGSPGEMTAPATGAAKAPSR
jgi:hypothetical protein